MHYTNNIVITSDRTVEERNTKRVVFKPKKFEFFYFDLIALVGVIKLDLRASR